MYRMNLVGGSYPSQVLKLPSSSTLMLVIRITNSNESFSMWLVGYNCINFFAYQHCLINDYMITLY